MVGKDVIMLETAWRTYTQNEIILQNNSLLCKLENCTIFFFCLFSELQNHNNQVPAVIFWSVQSKRSIRHFLLFLNVKLRGQKANQFGVENGPYESQ